jgi:hypothetical protein
MTNKIIWEVHDHDGQPDWTGYVDGEELYRVYLGIWSYEPDTEDRDMCETDEEGKHFCQLHLEGKLPWARNKP